MVRGLLTLNIVKPIKISSIEIELTGKTNTSWPEGVFCFVVLIMSIDFLARRTLLPLSASETF